MDVEPAHVNQVRFGENGRMVEIDRDSGRVAEDLKRIDPDLRVRFAEHGNPPFWAVYCVQREGERTTEYLVLTVKAHQSKLGVWTGLDQRVVERVRQIGHADYDYAEELMAHNRKVNRERKQNAREQLEEVAELSAHAVRKDLGARYKGRAFIP